MSEVGALHPYKHRTIIGFYLLSLIPAFQVLQMSYLDHIKQRNSFARENYLPLIIDEKQYGWTKREFAEKLRPFKDVFEIKPDKLSLHSRLNTFEKRNEALAPILRNLHASGVIDTWVGEDYSVNQVYGQKPVMLIERAAVSFFGIRGYGVHINGLVKKGNQVFIWIARRSTDKPFWPGKLDQMVAGGQPAGISLMRNVIKESKEEADIPKQLAEKAELVSEIHYRGESSQTNKRGLNVDTLFNYDLWLPEDFIPNNTDGEVDEFELMPIQEMAKITDTTNEFKDNCNLVNIDLLIRLGVINQKHPDFEEITNQLYAPANL